MSLLTCLLCKNLLRRCLSRHPKFRPFLHCLLYITCLRNTIEHTATDSILLNSVMMVCFPSIESAFNRMWWVHNKSIQMQMPHLKSTAFYLNHFTCLIDGDLLCF